MSKGEEKECECLFCRNPWLVWAVLGPGDTDEWLIEELDRNHPEDVNWDLISKRKKLSERFIEKYKDKLNWRSISARQKLSIKFIMKHRDKIHFDVLPDKIKTMLDLC